MFQKIVIVLAVLFGSHLWANSSMQVNGDWIVVCEDSAMTKNCKMVQTVDAQTSKGAVRLLQATVVKLDDSTHLLQVFVPLSVDLQLGVTVDVIGRALGTTKLSMSYTNCSESGCVAMKVLDERMLQAFILGANAKVGFRPYNTEETIILELSLAGFSASRQML